MKLTNLSITQKIQYADHKATRQDLVGMLFIIAACWLVMGFTDGLARWPW